MDAAVDEDAAGVLGVGDEEAGRVELVAGLGAEDDGAADGAGAGFGEGVAVGGVEAATEAAEDFLGGVRGEGGAVGGADGLGLDTGVR